MNVYRMDVNVTMFFSENRFRTDILQMSLAGIYFLWKKRKRKKKEVAILQVLARNMPLCNLCNTYHFFKNSHTVISSTLCQL